MVDPGARDNRWSPGPLGFGRSCRRADGWMIRLRHPLSCLLRGSLRASLRSVPLRHADSLGAQAQTLGGGVEGDDRGGPVSAALRGRGRSG